MISSVSISTGKSYSMGGAGMPVSQCLDTNVNHLVISKAGSLIMNQSLLKCRLY